MKYLVTGGAGFIGSHVARALLALGHKVAIIDDLSNSKKESVPKGAEFFQGTITDKNLLKKAMQNCDGVFHLAALVSVPKSMENPKYTLEVNALGTLRILEVMRELGVKKIVYSGTSAAYGDQGSAKNTEDMNPQTLSPYAYAKLESEYLIKTYGHLYGIQSVIFRYFNVFGPGQDPSSPYSAVIALFTSKIQKGENISIFGDGKQTRDFVFVDDVVNANLLAMNSSLRGEVINIGRGESISILDLISVLGKIFNKKIEPEFKAPRHGDIVHSCADISKARVILGFDPKVNLEDGLRRYLT
ncbi:NAD-dependent epimerase/dehydratase family protein [Candidatus Peregrinibacteria bacterium]|nr:NAD-dependent epimerase/dehydratase family protein [Candidatus Peregrinibacteria bacterium]